MIEWLVKKPHIVMALVTGYNSSSESETEEVKASEDGLEACGANSDIKRSSSSTMEVVKRRRLVRQGKGPWARWSDSETEDSDEKLYEEGEQLNEFQETAENNEINTSLIESSTFYGDSEKDYQNRGFLHPPVEVDIDLRKEPLSFKCYLPKRTIHVYKGHLNGTGALKYLPKTGHLFLSGGNDNMLRIWDSYHDRRCLRDYRGHSKPIKAIDFDHTGTSFLSAAFDQNIKIWNTETGKVTTRIQLKSTPNDVKFHPTQSDVFIVGLSNSKINQYDLRVSAKGGLVQTYDHHLSSILSLKYFPDGSKFISSSEDKTVRIWENQINIPVKQISDTTQHSMPFINIHPQHKYFCTQSMDNTIYTYSMQPKYKKNAKKAFKGHHSAGYGVAFTFSPDGHYICSGDSKSKVLIWDWTTTRLLKTININGDKPVTQIAWNPQETSKIICSGGAGKIYLLD
ncbi:hypothetical protein HG537_0E00940 [Torulaspora globosa]|uniref:Pre-mRNA-processing factor 17 n=1 Tax=Torulaspora globosa TaxID=48254 RepID=A0A7H9HTS8_9SACH|nr:hypothetical protein HG537_0E00940 [Torulaspora sp. CBS 2947]